MNWAYDEKKKNHFEDQWQKNKKTITEFGL